jgi:propanol-preferring alcohol dehydrogenase
MSSPDIPKKYKAVIYDNPGTISTKVVELDTGGGGGGGGGGGRAPGGGWKALPHPTQPGQVGGHEGVGKIVAMGPGTENAAVKVGQRVGVKWISGICGGCPACLSGHDGVCFNQKVSGYYTPGTYQQYVLGPADYVTPIPDELDSAAAAPM